MEDESRYRSYDVYLGQRLLNVSKGGNENWKNARNGGEESLQALTSSGEAVGHRESFDEFWEIRNEILADARYEQLNAAGQAH